MTYNYLEVMKADIRQWLEDNDWKDTYYNMTREELEEKLNEDLWNEDNVTGNASGSYYCNSYKAAEALTGNWDLLAEALKEFGCNSFDAIERGEEYCDVTIRCYLLSQAINEVLDEDFEEGEQDND